MSRLAWVLGWIAGCSGADPTTTETGSSIFEPGSSTSETGPSTSETWTWVGCTGSTPILLSDGRPSGFERCSDGTIHRAAIVAPGRLPIPDPACSTVSHYDFCQSDADCTNGESCVAGNDGYQTDCECVSSCGSDADCGAGEFCLPVEVGTVHGRTFAQCFLANCLQDSDCGSGDCALDHGEGWCHGHAQLVCRDADDGCRTNEDCHGVCIGLINEDTWRCDLGFDC